jgi:hypothetical protein
MRRCASKCSKVPKISNLRPRSDDQLQRDLIDKVRQCLKLAVS